MSKDRAENKHGKLASGIILLVCTLISIMFVISNKVHADGAISESSSQVTWKQLSETEQHHF